MAEDCLLSDELIRELMAVAQVDVHVGRATLAALNPVAEADCARLHSHL